MNNLLPKDKFDVKFIEKLRGVEVDDIQSIVPSLLEWLQDGNWPVAEYIIEYFLPHINKIGDDIISILKGNDELWKYWVLLCLIQNSPNRPYDKILQQVKYLFDFPTEMEKEAGVQELAEEIIIKFGYV